MLGGIAKPTLAACGEQAFFGSNHRLIEVDAKRGVVHDLTVPNSAPVAAVDHYRPPDLKGKSGISSLACNADEVVVALDDSVTAFIYQRASGAFDEVQLPSANEVASVALSESGDVALGLRHYGDQPTPNQVLIRASGADESRMVGVDDSSAVLWDGRTLLVGQLAQPIKEGANSASGSLIVAPASSSATLAPRGPQLLPDGRLVAAATSGLLVVESGGGPGRLDHSLGMVPCGEVVPMGKPRTVGRTEVPSTPVETECGIGTDLVVTDGAGNVYAAKGNHVERVVLS